ncbi:MAG TPA: FG-GAP-like repeat-containing protein [Thermoanaerobaculales bacterium]|nr:FG-GAP-like repeat-containing protein [Thermoanaerobaculales bacterium]HQN95425.1 FG-GAP-like repeat-containing protein [Thermoanaerobaculales bacterium]
MKRTPRMAVLLSIVVLGSMSFSSGPVAAAPTGGEPPAGNGAPARLETATPAPSSGAEMPAGAAVAPPVPSDALVAGWPVNLSSPGAGFPYTPTLFDVDGDGAEEIFLTGGNTFGLKGDGTFLPGWPTTEHQYMGYGTNDQKPGPSAADVDGDGDVEIMWSERDWYAGSAYMWCFNGRNADGSNMPGFPQEAPDDFSNALDVPFVLGDVDGDGDLEAWGPHSLGNAFVHYRISAFDHLGAKLFTRDLGLTENTLSLYFGDLDGSGAREMFAATLDDNTTLYLHAFDADGNDLAGFPVVLYTLAGEYLPFGPPVAADLDGDADLELLVGTWSGGTARVRAFHHDGSACAGFPIDIASNLQLFYLGLGDLTGDGVPELIATGKILSSDYRVYAIDLATGAALAGWPYALPHWPEGFPTVADVDGDGYQDVAISTDGGDVRAVAGTGQLLAGYPLSMSAASISGVAAGDIDGDGLFELVAATWDGFVYAWDTAGPALPGRADWPMRNVNARNTGVFGDLGASAIFSDGFESGDTGMWSLAVP